MSNFSPFLLCPGFRVEPLRPYHNKMGLRSSKIKKDQFEILVAPLANASRRPLPKDIVIMLGLFLPDTSVSALARTSKALRDCVYSERFWTGKCRLARLDFSQCPLCFYLQPPVTCSRDILQRPLHVLNQFRMFMKDEMCDENIDFVLDVRDLLSNPTVEVARVVTNRYMLVTSPQQVSHPSRLTADWINGLNEWEVDSNAQSRFCFAAQASMKTITILMDRDCVRRWLRKRPPSPCCVLCERRYADQPT